MSKRACTTSNNTTNKKQRTFLPPTVFKQVLAYCSPANTLHKQMWARIQPVVEFQPYEEQDENDGFVYPVYRYVRDTQTGCTGKKILTERGDVHANYRNCIECAQSVLDTDTQYDVDCDEFTIEPGHPTQCDSVGYSMIRCSNCVCVCGEDFNIGKYEDGTWRCENESCEHRIPDSSGCCEGRCDTWMPKTKLNSITEEDGTYLICTPCILKYPADYLK